MVLWITFLQVAALANSHGLGNEPGNYKSLSMKGLRCRSEMYTLISAETSAGYVMTRSVPESKDCAFYSGLQAYQSNAWTEAKAWPCLLDWDKPLRFTTISSSSASDSGSTCRLHGARRRDLSSREARAPDKVEFWHELQKSP